MSLKTEIDNAIKLKDKLNTVKANIDNSIVRGGGDTF